MSKDMDTDNRSRAIWSRLGGQLGVGLCVVGFLLVFLGWNGAASVDRIPSQFPYLISGGVAGLCFVVLGVGMIVVQNQRADRAALQATLRELQESLERAGLAQGAAGARPTFRKPAPRPEALAGARAPGDPEPAVESEADGGDTEVEERPAVRSRPITAPRAKATKAPKRAAKTTARATKAAPKKRARS